MNRLTSCGVDFSTHSKIYLKQSIGFFLLLTNANSNKSKNWKWLEKKYHPVFIICLIVIVIVIKSTHYLRQRLAFHSCNIYKKIKMNTGVYNTIICSKTSWENDDHEDKPTYYGYWLLILKFKLFFNKSVSFWSFNDKSTVFVQT